MGQAFNLVGNAFGTTTRVGGTIGGYLASNRAARAETRNQREGFGFAQDAQSDALSRLDPYASTGEEALSPLTGLLLGKQFNVKTGEFDPISETQRADLFQKSPGYQFRLDQAQKAVQNSQAARGNLLSGGALKELNQYTQGIASDEYGKYISQLFGLTSAGQNAATSQMSGQLGGIPGLTQLYMGGQNSAYQAQKWQNFSNAWQVGSDQVAQNHEKAGQTLSSMFGGNLMGGAGGSGGAEGGMGGMMSDISLKENIELVGKSDSGIPIYHFDYKDKKYGIGRYHGVMAQDILFSHPSSVSMDNSGYFKVDYSQLDVNFRRIQ